MTQETFNFSTTEAAEVPNFVQPGYWVMNIEKGVYVTPDPKPDGTPRTPYLEVYLSGKNAGQMKNKFYITPKTAGQLQYLHQAWYGKKLEKTFNSAAEVGAYFEKIMSMPNSQKIQRRVIVGGEETPDGKIYAKLPYTGFVIPDEIEEFSEFAFEPGTPNWIRNVTKQKGNAATASNDTILPDSSLPAANTMPADDDLASDLPF